MFTVYVGSILTTVLAVQAASGHARPGIRPGPFCRAGGFAACFPVLLSTMDAARSVPAPLLDTARTLGAGRLRTLVRVVFPACLPGVFTGLRMALPVALIVAVLAEMVGVSGAGSLLLRLQRTWMIPGMYACVLALGLTGWGLAVEAGELDLGWSNMVSLFQAHARGFPSCSRPPGPSRTTGRT